MEAKEIQKIFDSPVVRRIECIIIGTLRGYRYCYGKEYGEDNIRTLLMMRQCLLNSMFVLDDKNIELLTGFNESLKRQVIEARERCITLLDASTSSVHMDSEVRCDILIGANYPKDHPVQTTRAKKMWAILTNNVERFDIYRKEHFWDIYFDKTFVLSEKDLLYYESLDLPEDRFDEIELEIRKHIKTTEQFHKFFGQLSLFDLLWVRDFKIKIDVETNYQTYKDEMSYSCDWSKLDYFD